MNEDRVIRIVRDMPNGKRALGDQERDRAVI